MGRTSLISSLFFLEPYSLNLCKTCQKTHVTKLEDSLYFLNKVNYLKLLHMKLFVSCLVEFYPAELHIMSFNKIYSFLNFFLLLEERVAKKQQQKARILLYTRGLVERDVWFAAWKSVQTKSVPNLWCMVCTCQGLARIFNPYSWLTVEFAANHAVRGCVKTCHFAEENHLWRKMMLGVQRRALIWKMSQPYFSRRWALISRNHVTLFLFRKLKSLASKRPRALVIQFERLCLPKLDRKELISLSSFEMLLGRRLERKSLWGGFHCFLRFSLVFHLIKDFQFFRANSVVGLRARLVTRLKYLSTCKSLSSL